MQRRRSQPQRLLHLKVLFSPTLLFFAFHFFPFLFERANGYWVELWVLVKQQLILWAFLRPFFSCLFLATGEWCGVDCGKKVIFKDYKGRRWCVKATKASVFETLLKLMKLHIFLGNQSRKECIELSFFQPICFVYRPVI